MTGFAKRGSHNRKNRKNNPENNSRNHQKTMNEFGPLPYSALLSHGFFIADFGKIRV